MNKDKIINNIIEACHNFYDKEHPKLVKVGIKSKTEGEIREAAGQFVENFLEFIFAQINKFFINAKIDSKIGKSDYLKFSINYKGKTIENDKIQVDRHVFSNKKRFAFIENKTYLDSCYFDRALADFKKIINSLKQQGYEPNDFKFIVFAGQNAASENTLFFYEADFHNSIKHLTKNKEGVDVKKFFFLKGKRRSNRPLYKEKHELDDDTLYEFISYIINSLKI